MLLTSEYSFFLQCIPRWNSQVLPCGMTDSSILCHNGKESKLVKLILKRSVRIHISARKGTDDVNGNEVEVTNRLELLIVIIQSLSDFDKDNELGCEVRVGEVFVV